MKGFADQIFFLDVRTFVDEPSKSDGILELLKKQNGSTIVYFSLIQSLEKFCEKPDIQKIEYSIYHGKLNTDQRKKYKTDF